MERDGEETVPTVGYHPKKGAQTFHLARGEQLPEGWSDKPHPGQHANEGENPGSGARHIPAARKSDTGGGQSGAPA